MKNRIFFSLLAALFVGQIATAQNVFSPKMNFVKSACQTRSAAAIADDLQQRITVVVTCSKEASPATIANQMIEKGAIIRTLMGNQMVIDLPLETLDALAAMDGVLLIDQPSAGTRRTDTARKASHVDEAHAGKMAGLSDLPMLIVTSLEGDVEVKAWGDYTSLSANSMDNEDYFQVGDDEHSVGDWCTSGEAVVVGAYTSDVNRIYPDPQTGEKIIYTYDDFTIGQYAPFSSYGYDLSSQKHTYPDVAAPGVFIYAAGKINAYKGLLYVTGLSTAIPELPTQHIGARLEGRTLYISGNPDAPVVISSISGQKVLDTQATQSVVQLPILPNGVYAVKIGSQGSTLIRL